MLFLLNCTTVFTMNIKPKSNKCTLCFRKTTVVNPVRKIFECDHIKVHVIRCLKTWLYTTRKVSINDWFFHPDRPKEQNLKNTFLPLLKHYNLKIFESFLQICLYDPTREIMFFNIEKLTNWLNQYYTEDIAEYFANHNDFFKARCYECGARESLTSTYLV